MEKYFVIVSLLFSELDAIILEKCWRGTSAKENGDDSISKLAFEKWEEYWKENGAMRLNKYS